MLQIKTIKKTDPELFDMAVNEALADGWTLTRRCLVPEGFIAEMEREVITEDEKTCENCKHSNVPGNMPPCEDCNPDGGKCYWEAAE